MRKNGSRTESDVFDLTRDLDADRLGEIWQGPRLFQPPVLHPPYLMLHLFHLSDLWHMSMFCHSVVWLPRAGQLVAHWHRLGAC